MNLQLLQSVVGQLPQRVHQVWMELRVVSLVVEWTD